MFKLFFDQLPQRLLLPYRGYFWIWHIVAFAITAILVLGGVDWWFFQITRNEALYPIIMLAGIGGFFVPILLPVFLYLWGNKRRDRGYLDAAKGVAQASAISWIIVAVYKAFTGRVEPEFLTTFNSADISRNFQFGFLEHGIFWGWPSHHTVVAVAGATVLYLSIKNLPIRVGLIVWALIVASGASIGFHWLSDVVAGTIVGLAVGISVWRDIKLQKSN